MNYLLANTQLTQTASYTILRSVVAKHTGPTAKCWKAQYKIKQQILTVIVSRGVSGSLCFFTTIAPASVKDKPNATTNKSLPLGVKQNGAESCTCYCYLV